VLIFCRIFFGNREVSGSLVLKPDMYLEKWTVGEQVKSINSNFLNLIFG
jgi:hypothetical protein